MENRYSLGAAFVDAFTGREPPSSVCPNCAQEFGQRDSDAPLRRAGSGVVVGLAVALVGPVLILLSLVPAGLAVSAVGFLILVVSGVSFINAGRR